MRDFLGRQTFVARPGVPRLNPHHPLAAGLTFLAWHLAPGVLIDLAGSGGGLLGAGTAVTPGVGRFGPQTSYLGSSSIHKWPGFLATSNGSGTGDFTIAAVAAPASSPGSNLLNLGGTAAYATLALNFPYTGAGSPGVFSLQTYSGGSVNGATSTSVLTATPTLGLLLGRRAAGTNSTWWNGRNVTSAASSADSNSVAGINWYVGGYSGGGFECDCALVWAAAWNRALADQEIAAWFAGSATAEPLGPSGLIEWPRVPPGIAALNLTTDRWAPLESAHSFEERQAQVEFGSSTLADRQGPVEFAGSSGSALAADSHPQIEVGARQVSDRSAPDEAPATIVVHRPGPAEWLSTSRGDASTPAESEATQRRDADASAENPLTVWADREAPINAAAIGSSDRKIAIEEGTALTRNALETIETLLSALGSGAAPEWTSWQRVSLPPLIEAVAATITDLPTPAECQMTAVRDQLVPVEQNTSGASVWLPIEYAIVFGAATGLPGELMTAAAGAGGPVTDWLSPAEGPVMPAAPFVYVSRGRLRRTNESLGGKARAFDPLVPGETDNFAFDLTAEVGDASITAASWSCTMRQYQNVVDPQPQLHVLAQSAQTRIASELPMLFSAWPAAGTAPVPALLQGAFVVALIGGFDAAQAGGIYNLTAKASTSDGRTLSVSADLPIQNL